jgi:Ca2+-binding RTX toxin-like protein
MDASLLLEGEDTVKAAQRYAVDYDFEFSDGSYYSGRDDFRGTGFVYDGSGVPVAGTITAYHSYDFGVRTVSLTGLKLSASAFIKAARTVSTSDEYALFKKAFSGNDVITGGSWDDRLEGFSGNDKLTGGLDADRLYGGAGADTFIYKKSLDSFGDIDDRDYMDTIFDFSARQKDRIDMRAIDADEGRSGNQAFLWIGNAEFQERPGELRYEKVPGGVYVQADADGDGIDDLTVFVKGITALGAGDFLL